MISDLDEEAAAYLNAALEEEKENAEELLLLALRNVAEARGITKIAAAALNRESVYRALSAKGNPRLSTLGALLHTLGLRLAVEVKAA